MPFPNFSFLQELPTQVARELSGFAARLFGWLSAQHKEDGSHGAMTADSLTLTADTVTGATGDIDSGGGSINMTGTDASSVGGDFTANEGGAYETEIGFVGSNTANDGTLGAGINLTGTWVVVDNSGAPTDRRLSITDLATGMTPFIARKFGASNDYYIQPGYVSRGAGMTASLGNPNDSFSTGWWDNLYTVAGTIGTASLSTANSGSGVTASTASGTPVTLLTVSAGATTSVALYVVRAGLGSNSNDAANYGAYAIVAVEGTSARIVASNTPNMTITLSGLNVQGTQSSGLASAIVWVAFKIGD